MTAPEETASVSPVSDEELAAASTECAFVRIYRVGQVPDGYVRRFYAETEHGQMELAVARLDGKAYATSNYCTHLDCLLSSGKLQDDGLITYRRGNITVIDRAGLEEYAGECYKVAKTEYDRLLTDVAR